uniref:Uncharacterized protein n=1 Tax=mine drainage metagenome TaxID=410659 RepID=E6QG37_9ZZZZ
MAQAGACQMAAGVMEDNRRDERHYPQRTLGIHCARSTPLIIADRHQIPRPKVSYLIADTDTVTCGKLSHPHRFAMPRYGKGPLHCQDICTILSKDPNGSEQETHPCPEVMGKPT